MTLESRPSELRELVDQLDGLVPKEGAKLRIPASPDGTTTIGTQRGYLRLGIEFLRAGLEPLEPGERTTLRTCHCPLSIWLQPIPKRLSTCARSLTTLTASLQEFGRSAHSDN